MIKETPYWIDGDFKWYVDKKYQNYLITEQAENLPKIMNIGVFRVVNQVKRIDDYVLIDDKQNVVKSYTYSPQGAEQVEAFINILKVSKHFDDNESPRKRRSYER